MPHGDRPRTERAYRLLWARTFLRNAGTIESSERGVWRITQVGRSLAEADIKLVISSVREMSRKPQPEDGRDGPDVTDGEVSEEGWQDLLLGVFQAMPPDAFECLAQRILRESGVTGSR